MIFANPCHRFSREQTPKTFRGVAYLHCDDYPNPENLVLRLISSSHPPPVTYITIQKTDPTEGLHIIVQAMKFEHRSKVTYQRKDLRIIEGPLRNVFNVLLQHHHPLAQAPLIFRSRTRKSNLGIQSTL